MDVDGVYDADAEQRGLYAVLAPRYTGMLRAVNAAVGSVFQLSPDEFRVDDPATRKLLALAAEQVMRIDRSTREQLREVLQEGQKRGYSDFQIAHGVPAEDFGGIDGLYLNTWRGRAETISRTEVATAQNAATLDRYGATGFISEVEIVEHEDTDEPCAARNGKVVPISSKPGLLHPNCRMGLIPVVEEAPLLEAPPEPVPAAPPTPEERAEALRQKVLKADETHRAKVDAAYKVMSGAIDACAPVEEAYWNLATLPPDWAELTEEQFEARRQAKKDALQRAEAARRVVEQATDAYEKARGQHQAAVRRVLYVPKDEANTTIPIKIEAKDYTPEQRAAVKEAQTFLQRIMGKTARYPTIPVRETDPATYGGKRSYQTKGAIHLAKGQRDTATAVHELGHALEQYTYAWQEKREVWYAGRTAGEPSIPMNQARGTTHHEAWEKTKPDRFRDAYIGADYPGRAGSEVFSMGLEYLWSDAAAFARADPDMFRFVVAQLR